LTAGASGGSKTQQQIAKPMASDVEGKEWNSWDVEIFVTKDYGNLGWVVWKTVILCYKEGYYI
jgi:hypothetical protein